MATSYTIGMKMQKTIRTISAAWGLGGVLLLVGYAVCRLIPFAMGMTKFELSWWQWLVLIAWCVYMAYSEGYVAFYKLFAPRTVARAQYLARTTDVPLVRRIVAPLFCMGYFGAPKKRMITAYSLTAGIIILIILIHFVPQPWRGIIDSGVVLGLVCGLAALVVWTVRVLTNRTANTTDPEVA